MNLDGIDELINQLQEMHDNIEDDVDKILLEKAREYVVKAKIQAKSVMNKGYWTGNLAHNIKYEKVGKLKYEIVSHAHYSGFLEFGTRFMKAEPFMWPVYTIINKSTIAELKALFND